VWQVPALAAQEFAARIAARTDKQLSGNFRSSCPIVAQANTLYPRKPPMTAVGAAKKYREVPTYQHGVSAFNVITDFFLPGIEALDIPLGDSAVLAPTWYSLFPLGRRLREYGVSIVGPGARPYRRYRQFAAIAEQVCGYIIEPKPDAIAGIERTLFNTLLDVTGRTYFDIFYYAGRLTVFKLLDIARQLHLDHESGVAWLEAAAHEFSKLLVDEEYLAPSEQDVFSMSVEEMKADMKNNKVDIANLVIDDLGIYASPDAALKLSTIHNAKGREYQAVAIIDVHEGRIPFYQARTAEDIEEAKRVFYVGITRPQRYLLYVTDDTGRRSGPSRFLRIGTGVGVC
jgi:ATP-dependent DNA helicase UvrD/PcrA